MTDNTNAAATPAHDENAAHGFRRKIVGKVIKDKMHRRC